MATDVRPVLERDCPARPVTSGRCAGRTVDEFFCRVSCRKSFRNRAVVWWTGTERFVPVASGNVFAGAGERRLLRSCPASDILPSR